MYDYMNILDKRIKNISDNYPDTYLKNHISDVLLFIDAGHGGIIDGKYVTAPSKMYQHKDFVFYEGVYNRAIAWELITLLYNAQLPYVLVTKDNKDIMLSERVKYINLSAKTLIYKGYKPYLHSIHGNASDNKNATGIEIWTSHGVTKSDKIAEIYFNEYKSIGWKMRSDYSDEDNDKESNFYILKNTEIPAILSEMGFYTNEEQAIKMANVSTIIDIAGKMFTAHLKVIKNKII